VRFVLVVILLFVPFVLPACGEDAEVRVSAPEEAGHVHGLGVDPADESLFIATHSGLFRLATGAEAVERVGTSTQDTMGFTIAGPGRFLGSGHPGPDEPGPPNLGLIESRDAGLSWEPVSLAGEVDFHVLRYAHERIYGFDGYAGKLMQTDDGTRWSSRPAPAGLIDFVPDPEDRDRLLASTETGLARIEAGMRWQPVDGEVGLLAWPQERSLFVVDGAGGVHSSEDGGRNWGIAGEVGGQPSAMTSSGGDLFVALTDGTIKRSSDRGASWVTVASL
jgi:hypothetical protein